MNVHWMVGPLQIYGGILIVNPQYKKGIKGQNMKSVCWYILKKLVKKKEQDGFFTTFLY